MSTPESIEALRRANPRNDEGFHETVEATAAEVHVRMGAFVAAVRPDGRHFRQHHRLFGLAGGVALAVAATAAIFLSVGPSGVTPGVENAAAAIKKAATLSAALAERSGTATVRMTHDG